MPLSLVLVLWIPIIELQWTKCGRHWRFHHVYGVHTDTGKELRIPLVLSQSTRRECLREQGYTFRDKLGYIKGPLGLEALLLLVPIPKLRAVQEWSQTGHHNSFADSGPIRYLWRSFGECGSEYLRDVGNTLCEFEKPGLAPSKAS